MYLFDIFRQPVGNSPNEPCRLTKATRQELLCVAVLLPFCFTSWRVAAPSDVWFIDASLDAIAGGSAPIDPKVGDE